MQPFLAESGPQALEIMRTQAAAGDRFAMILLDAQMPDMDGFTLARRIQEDPTLAGPRLMMLSSVDATASGPELRATGLAHYIVKPITRAGLLKAILKVLGDRREIAVTAAPRLEEPPSGGMRVLLAEDNVVNQKVMSLSLKKLGHTVTVVADGATALEMYKPGAFDLIFMDVQMPGMDGYDATREIRERERVSGGRIAIVALTAHALKGDREICLEAGMDDYLSKPVRTPELVTMLQRWAPVTAGGPRPTILNAELAST
jgi:CheY-like chemotaxis protein